MVKGGEVYGVDLDPTVGTEIRRTRPARVISPDDMNAVLPRIIVAALTSKGQPLGCRPEVTPSGKLFDPFATGRAPAAGGYWTSPSSISTSR